MSFETAPLTYDLHKAVFGNDVQLAAKLLKSRESDVFLKDVHGNTPLHLAVMLGHHECVNLLLNHNAPVKNKNAEGWNPLEEAISYGHRPTIHRLLKYMKIQQKQSIHGKKTKIFEAMVRMPDFYLELRWDFQSWIPFASSILPSDTCKIYKKGTSLRLDTTLVNFNDRTWERGDVSFICKCDAEPNERVVILDNKARVFQKLKIQQSEMEIESEVDSLMSNDIDSVQVSAKSISFSRSQIGWIFKQPKTEIVGEYEADFYNIDNLNLDTRKRREHLSVDDIKRNKAMISALASGKFGNDEDSAKLKNVVQRISLPRPPECSTSWADYLKAPAGCPPTLGRQPVFKQSRRHFKASVAMSTQFPLSLESLLDILEIVAPFKHINKLRMFCRIKMPPGFPVRLEIPLLNIVSAQITFKKLEFRDNLADSLFVAPCSYREELNRFPQI